MIRKELIDDKYHYFKNDILITTVYKNACFQPFVLIKIKNNYKVVCSVELSTAILYMYHNTEPPNVIYDFGFLCRYYNMSSSITIVVNSDFECISIGNGYDDLINYGLNQIRIEKLKTLI